MVTWNDALAILQYVWYIARLTLTKIEIDEKVGKSITSDFDMHSYNRDYYYGYNYGPYYGHSYSPYYSSPHIFRGGQYNRYLLSDFNCIDYYLN